jgi:hypothetical protein
MTTYRLDDKSVKFIISNLQFYEACKWWLRAENTMARLLGG